MNRLTVHDPRGYPPKVIGKRLAARPQSLVGKTLYLVDCLFDNSEAFMDQLKRWFAEVTNPECRTGAPAEVIDCEDLLIGVSGARAFPNRMRGCSSGPRSA